MDHCDVFHESDVSRCTTGRVDLALMACTCVLWRALTGESCDDCHALVACSCAYYLTKACYFFLDLACLAVSDEPVAANGMERIALVDGQEGIAAESQVCGNGDSITAV